MNLHKDKELFYDVINEIAYENKISVAIIEKDYYVTLFLKKLIALDNHFIFKGGTSLSKGFKIISRFSEDIDLNYPSQLLTTGGRKKIKKEIIDVVECLGFSLINMDEIRSRRSFNQYRIDYSYMHKNDFLKQIIVVETAFQTESYPTENVFIQSMISDFLKQKDRTDLIKKYKLEPFKITVQSKERTLVDKVYAVADYYLSAKFDEHSRHIYDIYMLTKCIKLTDEIAYMFCDIRKLRKVNKYCYSAQNNIILSEVLNEIIINNCFKEDYEVNTMALCYSKVCYDEAIKGLRIIKYFLQENNM